MATISVLVAVDVENVLAQAAKNPGQPLSSGVYMSDTNGFNGSLQEGQMELVTDCHYLDTIQWTVYPIDPNTSIQITGFTGQAIPTICNPAQTGTAPLVYWQGTVVTQTVQQYQYSIVLSADGVSMTFDPFLNVVAVAQPLS